MLLPGIGNYSGGAWPKQHIEIVDGVLVVVVKDYIPAVNVVSNNS